MHFRAFVLSLVAGPGLTACVADWPPPGSLACDGQPCEPTTGSSGPDALSTEAATPTTSGAQGSSSTTTNDATTSSPGTTDDPVAEAPVIVEHALDPDYIEVNGQIELTVVTDHADGVRVTLEPGGDVIELPGEARTFTGHITALTGAQNGPYTAVLTPWRADEEGQSVPEPFTIALPEPGSQIYWEALALLGSGGSVAAMAVLPDGRFVEFGTYFPMGESRCYLRAHDKHGDWSLDDLAFVLPSAFCSAIDLTIDPVTGVLHVLADRKDDDMSMRWWVGEIPAWGKGAKKIGGGQLGDKALALAQHPEMVAVCGTKKVPTGDLDAFAVLIPNNGEGEEKLFDNANSGEFPPHWFSETSRDCTFSNDTLLLVGEARGVHVNGDDPRDRLMIVEYDVKTEGETWTIAGPGPGVQSRALAVDTDDQGRYHLAGYTCLDDCEPEGELRIYQPGGALEWQNPLGPLGSDLFGPHDIAWSPAGYSVIAVGGQEDDYIFKIQAFAPHVYDALWTFTPNNKEGLQLALAVAVGDFGEICAGGIGASNYPAVACIGG